MNGKPKSHRAIVLAAMHCTHTELDSKDKLLLAYLAQISNHGTGTNAYPGLADLIGVLNLTRRPAKERVAKNIKRGLIACTEVGNGRGNASVYMLCLAS